MSERNPEVNAKQTELIKRVNELLGEDALKALYRGLTDNELFALGVLMSLGRVVLHEGEMVGLAIRLPDDSWTSEGFVQ